MRPRLTIVRGGGLPPPAYLRVARALARALGLLRPPRAVAQQGSAIQALRLLA